MLTPSLLWLAAVLAPQEQPVRVPSLTGNIKIHAEFESSNLGNKRTISVYLPPDYAQGSRRYPVVYLHDGQNCFDGARSFIPNQEWRADETAESLIRGGLIRPVILVAVDNAGRDRADEYLASRRVPRGALNPIGGKADLYGKFLTEEVMPFINREYRTQTGPENTGLIGSSLGGLVTLHLGLTLGQFGRLGVVSPSVWWDDRAILKAVDGLPTKKKLRIWVDIGTKEGEQAVTDARALRERLARRGWQLGNDLAYYEDFGAEHNERAWANRFGMILMYLFGTDTP